MPFQIIRNDITKVSADAIVNTANPKPVIGSGTDSAIYAAAGEQLLLAARQKIGELRPGEAAYTDAFGLNAQYIIHTVGPVWVDGNHGEREILRSCYENAMKLADKLGCTSIAFPLISSGVYGFPKDEALSIAYSAIGAFVLAHDTLVTLVVLDRNALRLSEKLMGSIQQYIDDHTAQNLHQREYEVDLPDYRSRMSRSRELELQYEREHLPRNTTPNPAGARTLQPFAGQSLEEVIGNSGKSFQQRLFELIDVRGLDDVTVYKRANLDRKLFSNIRCKPNYVPKKTTAVALALALELNLPTMTDLLSRAGIALNDSDPFDLVVSYFVSNQNYNLFEINTMLVYYNQKTI